MIKSIYLPPSMKTALSTTSTTRLPWEESPRTSRPPPVSPSEGSSLSGRPVGIQSTATPREGSSSSEGTRAIQSTATPNEGFSSSEGPRGIQSTATKSDDLGVIVTQSSSPDRSFLSILRDQNHGAFTPGSVADTLR